MRSAHATMPTIMKKAVRACRDTHSVAWLMLFSASALSAAAVASASRRTTATPRSMPFVAASFASSKLLLAISSPQNGLSPGLLLSAPTAPFLSFCKKSPQILSCARPRDPQSLAVVGTSLGPQLLKKGCGLAGRECRSFHEGGGWFSVHCSTRW